jgi:ASC-1-like (ASCH) protein
LPYNNSQESQNENIGDTTSSKCTPAITKSTHNETNDITPEEEFSVIMKTHEMNLNPEPFEMIKREQKTIEMRLCDERRQGIRVGDRILFTHTESGEKLLTEVIALHKFESFRELYAALPLLKCGYTEDDIDTATPDDMDVYYSKERQAAYGVIGIEIELI